MTGGPATSLDATRRRIELRLSELMPPAGEGVEALSAAIADGSLAPGKRLRPLMTVLVAEDLGGQSEAALDIGCAIELVHAASLILDDLPCMDDADMRRGRPAVHRAHGEDAAVLSAVAMLSHAYALVAAAPGLSAEARLEAVAVMARAVGLEGLVGGQFLDLRAGREARPLGEIVRANHLKTGALFSAAIEIGAVIGQAGERRAPLRQFANELGQAFQLLDDLLDREASEAQSGKTSGRDEGKSTVVSLLGAASSRRRIERHVAEAHMLLAQVFGPGSRLAELLDTIFGASSRRVEDGPLIEEAGAR